MYLPHYSGGAPCVTRFCAMEFEIYVACQFDPYEARRSDVISYSQSKVGSAPIGCTVGGPPLLYSLLTCDMYKWQRFCPKVILAFLLYCRRFSLRLLLIPLLQLKYHSYAIYY